MYKISLLLGFLLISPFLIESLPVNTFERRSIPIHDGYEYIVQPSQTNERFTMTYEVKERDVFVETAISNFTFCRNHQGMPNRDGEGHIMLFLNDQYVDSIYTPTFIIKGLPTGQHKIRIELVHNDQSPYGSSEEFEVSL